MKKLNVLAAAALISTGAFAGGSLNLISRSDWAYRDNDYKKTGTFNSSSFEFAALNLKTVGKITESTSYVLELNTLAANSSSTNIDGTTASNSVLDRVDGTSGFIYKALFTKSFGADTSVSFGKQSLFTGGREWDYSSYNRYTTSWVVGTYRAGEQVGAYFDHAFMGQKFTVQFVNGNKTRPVGKNPPLSTAANATNKQTRMSWALGYTGDFMSGMIKPIIGYTLATATNGTHQDISTFAPGVQVNLPMMLTIEADLYLQSVKNGISLNNNLKTSSFVSLVRFNGENFRPFVKMISDKRDVTTTTKNKRTAYDVGLEYLNQKDDAATYHVVYSSAKNTPAVGSTLDGSSVKHTNKVIRVGVTFDAKIL